MVAVTMCDDGSLHRLSRVPRRAVGASRDSLRRASVVAQLALLGISCAILRSPGVNVEIAGRTIESVRGDDDQRFGIGIHEYPELGRCACRKNTAARTAMCRCCADD